MNDPTPGPWKAIKNPMRDDGFFVIRDLPATPYPEQPELMQMPPAVIPAQVSQADAYLIAAAPDLLAALKAITDASFGNPWHPDETRRIEAMAAAAIAKAEGRQIAEPVDAGSPA